MKSHLMSISYLGIGMLCIACFLPPVYLFTDALFLPKYYLFLIGVALCLASFPVIMLRCKGNTQISAFIHVLFFTYAATAVLECLYTLFCTIQQGIDNVGAYGTFDNPAGLALSLCVSLPMIAYLFCNTDKLTMKLLYVTACLLVVSTVLLTKSRTGTICMVMYVVVLVVYVVYRTSKLRKGHLIAYSLIVVISLSFVLVYVTSTKTDSTSGRYFILQQSWEMIKEHPIIGFGTDGFEREYMLRQADYFRNNPSSRYNMLADDMQHPLNEFVYLWVNYGIFAPLLLLVSLTLPLFVYIHKRNTDGMWASLPLLSVSLFCLFSYAFYYQISWMAIALSFLPMISTMFKKFRVIMTYLCLTMKTTALILVAYIFVDSYHEYKWHDAYIMSVRGKHNNALEEYSSLYNYFKGNRFFLYSYAMAAFMADDMCKAHSIMKECQQHWNGYNIELLYGDICIYSRRYTEAEFHFRMAHSMCPVRFAPLEGLYKTYDIMGNTCARDSVANLIETKSVKVFSSDVHRIKEKCKKRL